jgi:hypothetical protein
LGGLGCIGDLFGAAVGHFKHCTKPDSSIEGGNYYQLLKKDSLVHGVCHVVCAYILKVQFVAQNVQNSGYVDFPSKYSMYLK